MAAVNIPKRGWREYQKIVKTFREWELGKDCTLTPNECYELARLIFDLDAKLNLALAQIKELEEREEA